MLSFLRQKLPLLVTGATTAPLLCRVWTGEHHIEADSIRRPQKVLGRKKAEGQGEGEAEMRESTKATHTRLLLLLYLKWISRLQRAMGIRFSCTVALLRGDIWGGPSLIGAALKEEQGAKHLITLDPFWGGSNHPATWLLLFRRRRRRPRLRLPLPVSSSCWGAKQGRLWHG